MNHTLTKYTLPLLLSLQLQAVDTYTVDDLILLALENSPDLHISATKIAISKSKIDIANGAYLPLVDLQLSAGQQARTNIPADDMVRDDLVMGTLSAKQIIYDFGKTGSNVESLKYDSKVQTKTNEQDISDKIRDVRLSYYTVLQNLALIDVQKENVKLNQSQLYRSQKYFQAGIRTKIDISDAQVELIKAKLNLKTAEYDLKLAYATLDNVVGFKGNINEYTVYSQALHLDTLYDSLQAYNLDLHDSISFAYENKNELKAYKANIQASSSRSDLATSYYYPELYLQAGYTRQKVDKFANSTPKEQWQATLNLDWNLYKGGATDASNEEQRLELDKSHSAFSNAKLSIKKVTTEAYINVYKAKDTVELSQSLVSVSNEKFDQAGKRYEHGLSDYIELQQSRQGYIDAKASLVVNYYRYYQAIAYLDNAIGK